MSDESGSKETAWTLACAIDVLIGEHKSAGRQILTQRPDGGHRDDVSAAYALEHIDIGAGVDGGRRDHVPAAVPRQERQLHAI
mgnify:CR=1 FL=1